MHKYYLVNHKEDDKRFIMVVEGKTIIAESDYLYDEGFEYHIFEFGDNLFAHYQTEDWNIVKISEKYLKLHGYDYTEKNISSYYDTM